MSRAHPGETGFSLVELLVTMVAGIVVLTSMYGVLISQSREFQLHRENVDVTETLRGAVTLLVSEVEHTSAERSDLYSISAQTLELRSFQSNGTFCATGATAGQYGVTEVSGLLGTATTDSALFFRLDSLAWVAGRVTTLWDNPGGPAGTTTCTWTGGGAAPQSVQIATEGGSLAGIDVGSVVRGFRRTTYSLISSGGRWWLGRKLGDPAAATWQVVTGPLRAPPDGLLFTYYDASGAETAVPAGVVRIDIALKAESYQAVRGKGDVRTRRSDSVQVAAYVRR
jgi:type II secretory pathway pseudopilin PulG